VIRIEVHEVGYPLDRAVLADVRALFTAGYYRYHYAAALGAADRVRFLAVDGGTLVGYASYARAGGYAVLSNLLVAAARRGQGTGVLLDGARAEHARAAGLALYVSAICDDLGSQASKATLRLVPAALKIGYRRDVSAPGTWGSSVVLTNRRRPARELRTTGQRLDPAVQRARFLGRDAFDGYATEPLTAWYVDVLAGPAEHAELIADPRFFYAGTDLDFGTGRWHHCFQWRNEAFHQGLRYPLRVRMMPDGVRLHQPSHPVR
jgi:hypothetical protein